jgi:ATP-binding cassette subfamily C protein LapB
VLDLLKPLLSSAVLSRRLVLASLLIHLLGLAPAFYVTLIFIRYASSGLDATLVTITAGALLAMALEAFLKSIRREMIAAHLARTERQRLEGIVKHLLGTSLSAIHALPAAERAEALRGIDQIQNTLTPSNILAFLDAPFSLLFWLTIMLVAWPLGIAAMLIVLGTMLYSVFRGLQIRESTTAVQKAQLAVQSAMMSSERAEAVRAATAQSFLTRLWAHATGEARIRRFLLAWQQEKIQGSAQLAASLMSITVMGSGAKLATSGFMDFSILFGVSLLAGRMLALVTRPTQLLMPLMQAAEAQAALRKLLAMPLESDDKASPQSFSGQIELQCAAFTYPGQSTPVFQQLSIVAPPGQLLVIKGPNGSGKTTLARILTGLYSPTQGHFRVDNLDIGQLDLTWWRRQIVYVPQEPEFFDAPIIDNLSTVNPETTPETARQLLHEVGLGQWIDHHPDGLNQMVVQGGKNFSPGIRRRLALARALSSNGKLVIIDEPGEGLDNQGVQMVNTIMTQLLQQGRTMVLCMAQPPEEVCRMAIVIDLNPMGTPTVKNATCDAT